MPIYAYRCSSCGHAKDLLRKFSDPPLTQCPACSAETFVKQVTAAGFQLKGSGWYATDFRGGTTPAPKGDEGPAADKPASDAADKAPSKVGDKAGDKASSKASDSTASAKTADKPAPVAPAAAPTSGS